WLRRQFGTAARRGRCASGGWTHRGLLRPSSGLIPMRNLAPWRNSANVTGRFFVPILLVLLTIGAAAWPPARWTLILLLPLLAITVWDFCQRRHALRRNYPLVARVRWIMEDLRPYLRSYVVESNLDGRPFNHDARSLIYARAKGELDTHPFGTEL